MKRMRVRVNDSPHSFCIVTEGPRNHLLTIRPKGFESVMHVPASLFWKAVEAGHITILSEATP